MNMELNLRDIKGILHDIFNEELLSQGFQANIMPFTFVEYSGNNTLRKRTVLEKVSKWFIGCIYGGFYK